MTVRQHSYKLKIKYNTQNRVATQSLISNWARLNIKPENLWRTLRVRHRFSLWVLIMPSYLAVFVLPTAKRKLQNIDNSNNKAMVSTALKKESL